MKTALLLKLQRGLGFKNKNSKGFTLIELLVVIGILAVLLAITLIAINPGHQFAQANNTKRRSDILQILNAIGQYHAENTGQLPADVLALTPDAATAFSAANFPAICADLMTGTPSYIPAFPSDPTANNGADVDSAACAANGGGAAAGWDTGYQVTLGADNRVTVTAPSAEEGVTISVTR